MPSTSVYVARINPSGSISTPQPLLSGFGSSSAAIGQLQVAGSGAAAISYTFGNPALFVVPTVRFRDLANGGFGDATDLSPGFFPPYRLAIAASGRAAVVEPSGMEISLRVREPGGTLAPATGIDAEGPLSGVLVGLAGDGAVTLAWDIQTGLDRRVMVCTATPARSRSR